MLRPFSIACALGSVLVGSAVTAAPARPLADYLNPLGGTDSSKEFSRGNLYPAVSVPFGMNAWTPQTGENTNGWTYQYSAIRIRGIKLTHQPSPWINDYGSLSLMPVTGALRVRETERAALFSHDREEAHPYSYKVKLMDYGAWAEDQERHAWVGFYPQASDGEITISGVVPGGPAESAGLQRGDLLVSVDGQAVQSLRQLYRTLWRKHPGDAVGMQVLREESTHVIEIVAGDRYDFYK